MLNSPHPATHLCNCIECSCHVEHRDSVITSSMSLSIVLTPFQPSSRSPLNVCHEVAKPSCLPKHYPSKLSVGTGPALAPPAASSISDNHHPFRFSFLPSISFIALLPSFLTISASFSLSFSSSRYCAWISAACLNSLLSPCSRLFLALTARSLSLLFSPFALCSNFFCADGGTAQGLDRTVVRKAVRELMRRSSCVGVIGVRRRRESWRLCRKEVRVPFARTTLPIVREERWGRRGSGSSSCAFGSVSVVLLAVAVTFPPFALVSCLRQWWFGLAPNNIHSRT